MTKSFPSLTLSVLLISTFCAVAADVTDSPIRQANGVVRFAEPIILPTGAELNAFNPTAIVVGNKIAMIYRAQVRPGRMNQLRLAFSDDGIHFSKSEAGTVLAPSEPFDINGAEDPRVVKFGSTYYLTYVGDVRNHPETQCLATSKDLIHWEKKGVVLYPPEWGPQQVKAAVIVPEKIHGNYIMYFIGQKVPWHPSIGMAMSEDLIHWTELDHPVMEARSDHFDSLGCEPGPTPVVLPEGILLLYNGWNSVRRHCTGWVLFSKDDPSKIIKRCNETIIQPTYTFEDAHDHSVTFSEGLVQFKNTWYLYYGAGNHAIGLAEMSSLESLLQTKVP